MVSYSINPPTAENVNAKLSPSWMAHFEDKATIVAKGAIKVQVLAGHMGVYYILNLRVTFQKTT